MTVDSTKRHASVDGLLRWIGDLDHPFYDDERQRFVWYEASAIGLQFSLLLLLTIGPVASLVAPQQATWLLALTAIPAVLAAALVVVYSAAKGAPFVTSSQELLRPRLYLLLVPMVLFAIAAARALSGGSGDAGLEVVLVVAGLVGVVAGIGSAIWLSHGDDYAAPGPALRQRPERSRLDQVLRWIGDLDHPFYSEERQRFVWYEASAIGFQLILELQFALTGVALIATGRDAVPAVIVGMVPVLWAALAAAGYAHRQGARYFPKMQDLTRSRGLLGVGLLAIYAIGMIRLALDAPAGQGGFAGGFSSGAPIGFAVGIVAAVVVGWRTSRGSVDE